MTGSDDTIKVHRDGAVMRGSVLLGCVRQRRDHWWEFLPMHKDAPRKMHARLRHELAVMIKHTE